MKKKHLPAANSKITSSKVRVVDSKGEMIGVLSISDALDKARQEKLDLVEVSPNASPPVCKILDFGKYKYEIQKKTNESKKKQKTSTLKEIKVRPNIDPHDLGIKIKQTIKFLNNADKVKISMKFRGREIAKQEVAFEIMKKFKEETSEIAKIETAPKMEMRQLMMILAPNS